MEYIIPILWLVIVIWNVYSKTRKRRKGGYDTLNSHPMPRNASDGAEDGKPSEEMMEEMRRILNGGSVSAPSAETQADSSSYPAESAEEEVIDALDEYGVPAEAMDDVKPEAPAVVGESHVNPLEAPHVSPLKGAKSPAIAHMEGHIGEAHGSDVHPNSVEAVRRLRRQPTFNFERTPKNLRQAVVLSEVLGRPKAFKF